MRILLVQPTTYYPDGRPFRSRTRWLVGITLPYLASLTPRGVRVDLVDDRLSPIPYHRDHDLVGITATCATALRAFEIAREFRERGVPVVMGGFHVTLHPEEALAHCEAVVVGEAESVWPEVVEDARLKRLKPRYQASEFHHLAGLPRPRLELVDYRRYRVKIAPPRPPGDVLTTAPSAKSPSFMATPTGAGPWVKCWKRSRPMSASPASGISISSTTISPATGSMPGSCFGP